MATFEELTEAQIANLAKAGYRLFHSPDPEVSNAAKRALMKADKSVKFADIDAADQIDGQLKKRDEKIDELTNEIRQNEARRRLEEQSAAARARGLDPDEVTKAISDRHIGSWETAMEFVELTHRSAQPTPAAYDEPADTLPSGKEFWENPQKETRKTAHQIIDELQKRRQAQR